MKFFKESLDCNLTTNSNCTKNKIFHKYFFSKCDQIRLWSHLLKKSLMENFIFCAVSSMKMFVEMFLITLFIAKF